MKLLNWPPVCLCRVMKEASVSVMDASASWFLQVLASTATAAIPINTTLRTNILQHTK